ncbi:MAG TPA: glycosyltransferase 87 family protein [Candidatus Angelobacter sp.]|nr:glycosyltransferase 87 family protein [Candidatus Angelobacter sp.]
MPETDSVVHPADADPVVASASERIGGPSGIHRGRFVGFWTPLRSLVLLATLAYTVGYLTKLPCHEEAFGGDARYTRLCYSDIPYLYQLRGFADGWLPYIQTGPGQGPPLEYPVLTGFFMQVGSWLTGREGSAQARSLVFYDWNVVLLFACFVTTVVLTALTVRRRPWDAALVALAPGAILCAVINWDLFAVALTAGSMLAWSRSRLGWSGVLLGLAVAAKFYPVLLLGPLLLLCLRAGRMRAFWVTAGWAAAAWTVVNLPVYLVNHDGWLEFYSFSSSRGGDWGSPWYVLQVIGHPVPPEHLNLVAMGLLVLLCLGIALLIVRSPRRPRFAQVAFLVIAAFCLTNKVYSPQYVLWLIPLAALARPRWRDFLIWQTGEILYFVAIWYFLQQYGTSDKGLPEGWYVVAIMVHIVLTAYFAAMVVRDIVRPERDPVRSDGVPEHRDDPGGGVLDGAPDSWVLGGRRTTVAGVDAVLAGHAAPPPRAD